jgi:hypothetical protein
MDIPVKIERQGSQENDRLICANCSFPLDRLSGAQSKVLCPRCNTWLDIDPNCGGSCMKCHKTMSSAPATSCVETSAKGHDGACTQGDHNSSKNVFSALGELIAKARQLLTKKSD